MIRHLLIVLTILATPLHAQNNPRERANLAAALNDARIIGMTLLEFDADYGSPPSDKTRAAVEAAASLKLPEDDKTSDALFRQLFAATIIQNEAFFSARVPGAVRGGEQNNPAEALGKGKNAFGYIAGMSFTDNPQRPIVLAPFVPGTHKFDPKPFGGKAVVLKLDLSVVSLPIEDDGTVQIDGQDILSKDHPLWNGKAPDLRLPDVPKKE